MGWCDVVAWEKSKFLPYFNWAKSPLSLERISIQKESWQNLCRFCIVKFYLICIFSVILFSHSSALEWSRSWAGECKLLLLECEIVSNLIYRMHSSTSSRVWRCLFKNSTTIVVRKNRFNCQWIRRLFSISQILHYSVSLMFSQFFPSFSKSFCSISSPLPKSIELN